MRRARRWLLPLAGCAVVATLAGSAPAQPGGSPEPDSTDHRAASAGGGSRNEPTVAVHPRNPRVVVTAAHEGGGITSHRSDDGGRTWRRPSPLPQVGLQYAGDPHLAYDSHGRLFAAYILYRRHATGLAYDVGGLVVARSDDSGVTWRAPVYVRRNSTSKAGCHFADFPALAVDARRGSDRIYVAWQSLEYEDAACSSGYSHPVYVSRSDDGGRTWSARVSAPVSAAVNPYIPTLATGPRGEVLLTFAGHAAGGPACPLLGGAIDVHVARSTDLGRRFRDSIAMADVCVPGTPVSGPMGVGLRSLSGATYRLPANVNSAVHPRTGVVVTVVGGEVDNRGRILVARSRDGGRSWDDAASPAPLSSVEDQQFPRLAAGPNGSFALLYLSQGPGPGYWARAAVSRNEGRTFSSPLQLSSVPSVPDQPGNLTFIGDYHGLVIGSDGLAHPVWTDLREQVPAATIYTKSFRT